MMPFDPASIPARRAASIAGVMLAFLSLGCTQRSADQAADAAAGPVVGAGGNARDDGQSGGGAEPPNDGQPADDEEADWGDLSGTAPNDPKASDSDEWLLTVLAAMQEPRVVFNNPWTAQDLADERIDAPVRHSREQFVTWKPDYERRRARCVSFGDREGEDGERICVPSKTGGLGLVCRERMLEYGYYCGAGRPSAAYWGEVPVDGVDYCCYLHDKQTWSEQGASDFRNFQLNSCGMLMCLNKMTEFPAGAAAHFPDTEDARQCIYNWASVPLSCPGNQSNDAPPPQTRINP